MAGVIHILSLSGCFLFGWLLWAVASGGYRLLMKFCEGGSKDL